MGKRTAHWLATVRDARGRLFLPLRASGKTEKGKMLHKEFLKPSQRVRITFEFPGSIWATSVAVVGDFNDWDPNRNLMAQRADGTWAITLELISGQAYEFRYLIDGKESSAEWSADGLLTHCGTTNSIITT